MKHVFNKSLTQDASSTRALVVVSGKKPSDFRVLNGAFPIAKLTFPCSKVGVVLKGRSPLKSYPSLWYLAPPFAPPHHLSAGFVPEVIPLIRIRIGEKIEKQLRRFHFIIHVLLMFRHFIVLCFLVLPFYRKMRVFGEM